MSDVSDIVVGKVTAIMPFGAFVQLGDGSSGLVHISEISEEFVKNVGDLLHAGQTVKVLCLGTEHDGKKRLSIKRATAILKAQGLEATVLDTPSENRKERKSQQNEENERRPKQRKDRDRAPAPKFSVMTPPPMYDELKPVESGQFEDKLARFMKASDERLVDLKRQTDNKRGGGYVRRG